MAGLYEAAIEALCVRDSGGRAVRPKIVASTATVRRARDQIQALFGRSQTRIFPPPGPNRQDSFFARTVPAAKTPAAKTRARLYLGIAAQGRNPKVMMRRVWLAAMGAAERAYRDAGGHHNHDNPADPYMTVLGYFKGDKGEERPGKQVELDALLAAPEGYGDDVPIDPDFHARRLPKSVWRRQHWLSDGIQAVIHIHRLREVVALTGFTRFVPIMPDIHGEYEVGAKLSALALEPQWFPAVENRGEGLFLQLRGAAVENWLERPAVTRRLDQLDAGRWKEHRKSKRDFPKGPYILLHTLSHLLIESLAMRCGYPASSIRERVYVDYDAGRYGLLLYTASPDAEGTLGGLVSQARHIETHLAHALRTGALCSNDPICAQHTPGDSLDERWLQGAACHGCALIAETSCEMRNDYLDRALVVPTLATAAAAFFVPPPASPL